MNHDNLHLETHFEKYISSKLIELGDADGWRISRDDTGFDPNTALYMPDFIEYVTAARMEKAAHEPSR